MPIRPTKMARATPIEVPRPGSVVWERAGDPRLLLGSGYALLLQVSHPTVGAGVSDHSQFLHDPWGRLLRTLDYSYTMIYGGPRAARRMASRIRAMHVGIRGTLPDGRRYEALEPQAYAWVHATLAEAIVRAHARFARPLGSAERERFWGEWRALGRLLGIREHELPANWQRFDAYFERMVERRLMRTPAAAEVLAALRCPAPPPAPALLRGLWPCGRMPLGHLLGLASVGLLPAPLRARLGLRWTVASEFELRAVARALRGMTPLLPPALANIGPRYLQLRAPGIERRNVRGYAAAARS